MPYTEGRAAEHQADLPNARAEGGDAEARQDKTNSSNTSWKAQHDHTHHSTTTPKCAELAHDWINRAYRKALGDITACGGRARLAERPARACVGWTDNPAATPEQSHESWLHEEAEGWEHGASNGTRREDTPCFVPYAELPPEQRAKDYLFLAAVQQGHAPASR